MIDISTLELPRWDVRIADYVSPGNYAFETEWEESVAPIDFVSGKTAFLRAEVSLPLADRAEERSLAFHFQNMEGLLRIDFARPVCRQCRRGTPDSGG